jgi:hypothetical protein
MLVARVVDMNNMVSPHSSSLKSGWKYLKITSAFLLPITGTDRDGRFLDPGHRTEMF